MISDETRKRWDYKIEELSKCNDLNDWEIGFVDSLDIYRSKGNDLTMQQSIKLSEIAEKYEV